MSVVVTQENINITLQGAGDPIQVKIAQQSAINLSFTQGIAGLDGQGVPLGGTTGQVLVKASGDDYDTEWAPPMVPYTGATGDVNLGTHGLTATHLILNTAHTTDVEPVGTVAWNSVYGTAEIKLNENVKLQLGQESYFYGKASGAIANGDVVQFASVQGDHVVFKKAVASEVVAFPQLFMGIATEDIANGSFGYVTNFGSVGGINTVTPGWAAGDILYFDNATGGLTKVAPIAGEVKIVVAVVQKAATSAPASNGILLVRPDFTDRPQSFTFVQATAPTVKAGTPYVWWDTSGGNLTVWIESGV